MCSRVDSRVNVDVFHVDDELCKQRRDVVFHCDPEKYAAHLKKKKRRKKKIAQVGGNEIEHRH